MPPLSYATDLRGLGNLRSSAVYNQGQLTLIFNTISCDLQSKAAYIRVFIGMHIIDYWEKDVVNQPMHKFYKR